jgi:uncharacterized damage-inducible protein DinB
VTADIATPALRDAASTIDAALGRLEDVLSRISDGDLHLASPVGGWTVAEVVSHISVCTLIWLGDVERLRQDPELGFFFREEIGHDAVGYPPPTADLARRRVASTRRTVSTCLPATDPAVLNRTVEIPDLGTKTVAEWTGIIAAHTIGHVDQAIEVLRSRDALPEEA